MTISAVPHCVVFGSTSEKPVRKNSGGSSFPFFFLEVTLILDRKRREDLIMRETESRMGYIASCCYCGSFLQETKGDCCTRVICPKCGRQMVVIIRKGKVTTFMDRRSETRSEANPGQKNEQCLRLIHYDQLSRSGISNHSASMVAEKKMEYGKRS